MKYVKHPVHGNKHIPDEDVHSHVADGWVIWPRPASIKAGIKLELPAQAQTEPVKRGPGRPKKVAK